MYNGLQIYRPLLDMATLYKNTLLSQMERNWLVRLRLTRYLCRKYQIVSQLKIRTHPTLRCCHYKGGRVVRFSVIAQKEVTNKSGRRYMKLNGKDDAVLAVYPAIGDESVSLYTKQTRLLCFPVS